MEHHGNNPRQNVIAIIPARFASTRLPGKLLLDIAGKPLILHTLGQAALAKTVSRVIVATDDERILKAVANVGGEARMTSPEHASGSDRVAEIAETLPQGSIIVNVQGDEPLISPDTIDSAVEALQEDEQAQIATTCEPIIGLGELLNGNVVKVVTSEKGRALYFSRSPMPFPRDASLRYNGDPNAAIRNEPELLSMFRKHTGVYAYRREYLLKFAKLPTTVLERFEMLEQLRALEDGAVIKVVEAAGSSVGVDTPQDLDDVRLRIEFPKITFRGGTDDDISAISRVYLSSVRRSYAGLLPDDYLRGLTIEERNNVFRERMKNGSYGFLVAEHEDEGTIGFIDYAFLEAGNYDHQGRIFSFYFVPEFQRQGLGSLLFRRCLRQMKAEGYQSVCLDTFEASRYRSFYDKMNGKRVAAGSHEVNGSELPTVIYGWTDLSKI